MRRFADLMDRLTYTPSRNGKLRLIEAYMRETPDPDRGWALAALTGSLDVKAVKPALLRGLIAERVDEQLFRYSHDFVGDLAETIALLWPTPGAFSNGEHEGTKPFTSGRCVECCIRARQRPQLVGQSAGPIVRPHRGLC